MKKSFVGIVFLIFILLSAVTVFADTAETFWVNPAWLHQTDQKYLTPDQKSLRILSTTVCYSQQEVVSCLRENFRNRVTNFSFNMLYNYNVGDVGGILTQAVDEATANDDYLKFSIQAYNSRWSGHNGNVTVDYAVTFVSTASEEQQVTDRVDQILDSIITAGMNDEEKEKAIHDWVAANVAYDETLQEYSAWAALFLGYTVCQGYSLLTCRMLQESDVPVRIINSESMHHSWNMVNLCGYWYHLDVAWDDPVPDVPGRILYTYYNLSDQEISSGSDPHYNWTADAPDAPISYVEGGCDNVFYEQYYLARSPDVARAVKSGVFGTGWEHFLACGESEGRGYNKPDAYGDFNEIYYLARNSDVARAVEKGIFGTGWDHFSACGEGEGRSYAKPDAYGDFNEGHYLSNNSDVAKAVQQGAFGTGWEHFQAFGRNEGRSYAKPDGYEGFNEAYYLARNADVARAVQQGVFGTGWEHYRAFGKNEGRSYAKPYDYEGVAYGGVMPGVGNGSETTDSAPDESPKKTGYFDLPTPPDGFEAVVGWMQAIDIHASGLPSTVEIDWMQLYTETSEGVDVLLTREGFDEETDAMSWYGLYIRDPWYYNDWQEPMPFEVQSSTLIIKPNEHNEFVYHWWTSRSLVPHDAEKVWFEAKIRISGEAGVQAGIDYWRDLTIGYAGYNVNNTEAGVSDWFGSSTSDWQIITVGK